MRCRSPIGSGARAVARVAAPVAGLLLMVTSGHAFEESKYPDLKGQWDRTAAPRWPDAKSAPLTPEYRAIFEENLKDQAAGGQAPIRPSPALRPACPGS